MNRMRSMTLPALLALGGLGLWDSSAAAQYYAPSYYYAPGPGYYGSGYYYARAAGRGALLRGRRPHPSGHSVVAPGGSSGRNYPAPAPSGFPVPLHNSGLVPASLPAQIAEDIAPAPAAPRLGPTCAKVGGRDGRGGGLRGTGEGDAGRPEQPAWPGRETGVRSWKITTRKHWASLRSSYPARRLEEGPPQSRGVYSAFATDGRPRADPAFGLPVDGERLGTTRPQRGPFEQRVERRAHRLSPLGQVVFDLGRHLRIDGAADDAVALELAELLDQHLLRDGRDRSLQLREAQDAAREEVEDDHHLPAPLQDAERALDAARRHVGRDVFELTCG